MIIQKIKILIFFLIIPFFAFSQSAERPKIGLALSGGGAKGIAHLGLIRKLDSLDIKPDYITGTSMGAIIGALYAAGYSGKEIEKIIEDGDWDYVLSDKIPLRDIDVAEKHDYERYMLTLNFSGNIIPKLPSGIVYGQHISEYFSKLTWRVAGINDFNEFEIPYKCISADLISGNPYFFESGDLATAMRSSMSIPTIFSPVDIDTMLLIDGGVYRNFPVIDVKRMGAEKIIGSYVGFKEKVTKKDMESLPNVLVRSSTFSGIKDIHKQEEMCDIVLKYDLHGLGPKDFKKGMKIVEYGLEAINGSEELDSLVALSNLLKTFPKQERKIIPERDSITISGFETEGLSMVSNEYIFSKSGIEIGDKISKYDMTVALNNMMGTLLFEKITYTLKKDTNTTNPDSFVIRYNIVEKARGQLLMSINYDNIFGAAIISNVTIRNLLLSGSRTQFRLNLSKNPIAVFRYDAYFGKNKRIQSSFISRYEGITMKSHFFVDEEKFSVGNEKGAYVSLITKLAYNFNSNNQLGVDISYQGSSKKFTNGAEYVKKVSKVSEDNFMGNLYYSHNNIDRQFYPTKGSKLFVSFTAGLPFDRKVQLTEESDMSAGDSVINLSSFAKIDLHYKHVIKLSERISIYPEIRLGLSYDDLPFVDVYSLGGNSRQVRINNINMLGHNPYFIRSDNYIITNLSLQYNIIDNLFLTLQSNVAAYSLYDEDFSDDEVFTNLAGGMSVGYKTPIGPIDAGFSINHKLQNYWHINIGFPF